MCALGDIDEVISSTKNTVKKANDITSEVLDGLHPIQTDVESIKDTYGSTRSEDFNKALTDADSSGTRQSPAFSSSVLYLVQLVLS